MRGLGVINLTKFFLNNNIYWNTVRRYYRMKIIYNSLFASTEALIIGRRERHD
jgi:hypothetical protein